MLYHKLLVALFAVPFVVAQDAQPSGDAAAPAPAATTRTGGSIGGNTENTGHGYQNATAGNWTAAEFTIPNTESYWVNEAENTAIWTPYEQAVDLVIFNSNTSLLAEHRTVAQNIPAGVGTWTGMISGFTTGNNYILVLALNNDPTRKIGQTRGFWIKRNGTLPAPIPENAAGQTLSGGGVAATGTAIPSAPAQSDPANASGTGAGAAGASPTSGAGKLAASVAAAIGAGALAFTLF
jgi:hypothetical protein